jgi:molybdopterin molybdotransferase
MHPTLITINEAKTLIKANSQPLHAVTAHLNNALNTVLANDVFSPIDMPGFKQSSMDGYAICFADLQQGNTLQVIGESYAGITQQLYLQPQTALRIFTGAPLPANADTVVMQEHVTRNGNEIWIDSPNLANGVNVRNKGAEITKGTLAMQSGELLTPAAIGYLAGLGITTVNVHPFPTVQVITTGKEIITPGVALQFGQVYESNSFALKNALKLIQLTDVQTHTADDNLLQLQTVIANGLQQANVILITGGVSVGDHDLVPSALANCGVETIFHKVKQRPGKPLFFGKKENKLIFGLPGNPSSVLSCFYNYVLPAIQYLMNRPEPFIETRLMKMKDSFVKNIPFTQFLKGRYSGDEVLHLGAQESFRLSSFAVANCLIEIPAEKTEILQGEWVKVHVI